MLRCNINSYWDEVQLERSFKKRKILWTTIQPEEMPELTSQAEWINIANKFYKKTNFLNCIRAVDGKHIRCMNPKNAGSMFYNYKNIFP